MKATIFVVLILMLVGCKSTLVNYALEKMLQCGAKKYPVRNLLT